MSNSYTFDKDLSNEELEALEELEERHFHLRDTNSYLDESDFYSSSDDRVWQSNIEDIDGGDNFADYCEYIFGLYEEEGYYDN